LESTTFEQLKDSNKTKRSYTRKIETTDKFVDTASLHYRNISNNGKIFVWGERNSKDLKHPLETELGCFSELFIIFK
jgi:hypothetical protein